MSLDRLSRIRHLKRPSGVFGWEESEERRERVDTPAGEVWRVHSAHSDKRVQHVWMFFVPESLVSLKGVAFVSLLGGWYLGDRLIYRSPQFHGERRWALVHRSVKSSASTNHNREVRRSVLSCTRGALFCLAFLHSCSSTLAVRLVLLTREI